MLFRKKDQVNTPSNYQSPSSRPVKQYSLNEPEAFTQGDELLEYLIIVDSLLGKENKGTTEEIYERYVDSSNNYYFDYDRWDYEVDDPSLKAWVLHDVEWLCSRGLLEVDEVGNYKTSQLGVKEIIRNQG